MKKIFSKRLLELVGDQPVAAFARFVGIGQNSIDRYLKMQRTPNGDAIRQIAQAANPSVYFGDGQACLVIFAPH